MTGPLLAIFAHPDDETFSSAGLMRAAIERGLPVTVVSATRGEAGESGIPGLGDPERLGAVREAELREAMRELGVADVRFLGYRDSGLGSDEDRDPDAFVRAPIAEVAERFASLIRDIRPHLLVTFGPDGIYGHPDHLHVHNAASLATRLAADSAQFRGNGEDPWPTPAVYFATAPREDMLAIAAQPNGPFDWLTPEMRANLGTPRAEITHVLDVHPWAKQKEAAILAHRTQTGPDGPLDNMPPETRIRWLAREFYVRSPLSSTPANSDDILAALVAVQTSG